MVSKQSKTINPSGAKFHLPFYFPFGTPKLFSPAISKIWPAFWPLAGRYFKPWDSAFSWHTWLLKPYGEKTRDPKKQYFNKRLCSARVVSEHAYGILKGRWRILYKKTEWKLRNIRHIIMACITLHNICIAKADPCKPRWRLEVKQLHLIRREAPLVRGPDTDDVRMAITEWFWGIQQGRLMV